MIKKYKPNSWAKNKSISKNYYYYGFNGSTLLNAQAGYQQSLLLPYFPSYAFSKSAIMIFFMPIMALKARSDFSLSFWFIHFSMSGEICQEKPYLSLHQPHWLSCPPFVVNAFQ